MKRLQALRLDRGNRPHAPHPPFAILHWYRLSSVDSGHSLGARNWQAQPVAVIRRPPLIVPIDNLWRLVSITVW